MRHKAAIHWWIWGCTLSGILLPGIVAAFASSLWMDLLAAAVALLVIGCCGPQTYETTPGALLIRAGFTTRRIPYSDITDIRRNPERVEIECGPDRLVVVAPANPEVFLTDLTSRRILTPPPGPQPMIGSMPIRTFDTGR